MDSLDVSGGGDSGDLMGVAANGSTDTRREGIVGTGGNEVVDSWGSGGRLSDAKDGRGLLRAPRGLATTPPSEVVPPSVSLVLRTFSSSDEL